MKTLAGVSATALGVARMRAAESRRPDRLFDDPYAAAFAEAAPEVPRALADTSEDARELVTALTHHIALRTRFLDDWLVAATGEGGCRQVVILAAGLDTRGFRLEWPAGTRLFEVDLPEVIAFKEPVLAERGAEPACERSVVAADLLAGDWPAALRAAGFRPEERTAWLIEGLLVYLSHEEAAGLLTVVGEQSAPGSRLAVPGASPFWDSRNADRAARVTTARGLRELWKGGLDADAAQWLTGHGWTAVTHGRDEVAARYGRPERGRANSAFVTAVR